jgi:hypothetical protein
MLSLSDDWNFSVEGLATLSKDGKGAVRGMIHELEEAGYLYRERIKSDNIYTDVVYHIFDYRCSNPAAESRPSKNRPVENAPQYITNKYTTNKSTTKNNTPLTPQGGNRGLKAIVEELPSETREAVQGFIEMRKKIRAPLTERALRMSIKKAMELSGGDVQTFIAIFDQSTERSWRGIFPLQKDKPKSTGNPFIDLLESGEFND